MNDRGDPKAPYLVVGSAPGTEEIIRGDVMVGRMSDVLRMEFATVGIPYTKCYYTNLWQHAAPEKVNKYNIIEVQQHRELFLKRLYHKMQNRKAVLIMGSETVQALTNHSVEDVTGLRVESMMLVPMKIPVVASVNPAIVFHSTQGEVQFAMRTFKEAIEKG